VRAGYHIVVTQSYMSRIRGGHNTFAVRVSAAPIQAGQEAVDLLIALDADTVALHRGELAACGLIIADAALECEGAQCVRVPFKELADRRHENVAALGVVGAIVGLAQDGLVETVEGFFGRKHPEETEANRTALAAAYAWGAAQGLSFRQLAPVEGAPERLMMAGNDAIALGAMSAGLKFMAFYPMTPSTGVSQAVAGAARRLGIIAEQAEDEIAAINMALGASFAGAPAMVATSGGGFALMVEGLSLAGMTETPVVIVLGQRPGPATGLPTRTEQGDLDFALYAAHGEFPRAILAPGSVEQCFHLTRRAFDLAERYQSPVFVMTDQYLADSYRAVEPFDIENLPAVRPWETAAEVAAAAAASGRPYLRHAITDDGVSPRLLPGLTERLVVTDSDEHTEDGHLTEDLGVRKLMVEKRLRKLEGLRREALPPDYVGPEDAEVLLVCWGSTLGPAVEAAATLTASGTPAAVLHFSQVWPLAPEGLMGRLAAAARVVCIEGNATGQFARLLYGETGFLVEDRIARYDGLPFTPESILREL
jgi:2-oxoglutarate ferredoxin oxidoreductase subunit alpha